MELDPPDWLLLGTTGVDNISCEVLLTSVSTTLVSSTSITSELSSLVVSSYFKMHEGVVQRGGYSMLPHLLHW
jgi:hypothetical protein